MPQTISDTARTHLHWALTDGVGPIVFGRIGIQLGDVEKALGLPASNLEQIKGIGRDKADKIARSRDSADVDAEIAAAAEHGVRIICRDDAAYPPGLKRIPDGPIVLYVKGELRDTDAIAIAVVGSRRCTIYGSEQARRFGELLAGAGFTVVSGLARGIDAFAHHGAIESRGRAIAILGCGLSEVYPPDNRALADKVVEHGALLSELPMRRNVQRENFPPRNRLIAGLTLGTVIVEAAQRSGALITARLASEYNREVFAVPGRIQDPMSQGTNALIRDGAAKLTTCLEDILDELGEVGQTLRDGAAAGTLSPAPGRGASDAQQTTFDGLAARDASEKTAKPRPALAPAESQVYAMISYDPILQDAILSALDLPPGEILAAFTALELKGLIKRLPGQQIVRRGTA